MLSAEVIRGILLFETDCMCTMFSGLTPRQFVRFHGWLESHPARPPAENAFDNAHKLAEGLSDAVKAYRCRPEQGPYDHECPICLEYNKEDVDEDGPFVEERITLLCGHSIHETCLYPVDEYTPTVSRCPICNRIIERTTNEPNPVVDIDQLVAVITNYLRNNAPWALN
jgi:hypothetical protein